MTEREAIVAWLRGEAPRISTYYEDMRDQYVHDLADAIERGDHLTPERNSDEG